MATEVRPLLEIEDAQGIQNPDTRAQDPHCHAHTALPFLGILLAPFPVSKDDVVSIHSPDPKELLFILYK